MQRRNCNNMDDLQLPVARKEGLVIQELPDEILVYDLKINKAHCLNETAAFVWKACDGKNSVADITKLFGNKSNSQVPEDLIWLALDQLSENNLLEKELEAKLKGQTRREVIKKIGLASIVALPIISALIFPQSALAVFCPSSICSNVGGTGGCDPGMACCNGNCVMPMTCSCP